MASLYYGFNKTTDAHNLIILADSVISILDDISERQVRAKVLSLHASNYAMLAQIAYRKLDFNSMINHCNRGIKAINESLNLSYHVTEKLNLGRQYSNLAIAYKNIYTHASQEKGIEYESKSISIFREIYQSYPDRAIQPLADMLLHSAISRQSLMRSVADLDTATMYCKESLQLLETIEQNNPNGIQITKANVYKTLGQIYTTLQKYQESIDYQRAGLECLDIDVALKTDATQRKLLKSDLYTDMGNNYFYLEEIEQCKNAIRQGIIIMREIIAKNPEVYNSSLGLLLSNYGYMCYVNKEYEEAEQSYIEAISLLKPAKELTEETVLSMQMSFAKHNMGDLCLTLHRYDEAMTNYEDALYFYGKKDEVNPGSIDYQLVKLYPNIAFVYMTRADFSGAHRNIDKALKIDPKDPRVLKSQSLLTCIEGNPQAAAEVLATLREARDADGFAVYDQACQDIQALLQLEKLTPKSKTALKKLNKLLQ